MRVPEIREFGVGPEYDWKWKTLGDEERERLVKLFDLGMEEKTKQRAFVESRPMGSLKGDERWIREMVSL